MQTCRETQLFRQMAVAAAEAQRCRMVVQAYLLAPQDFEALRCVEFHGVVVRSMPQIQPGQVLALTGRTTDG